MTFSKNSLSKFFVVLFVFFNFSLFYAEENHSRTVKVGYYENEIFQEGARPGAVKTGYAYEYYQKLSEYTGWKYEYVYGGFAELYNMLVSGDVDFLAGLAWKDDRERLILYPEKAMGKESYTLVKHDTDSEIAYEFYTLNNKKIGVLDSAMVDSLRKFLNEHKIEARIQIFNSYVELFRAFDSNSLDVIATEGEGTYGRNNSEVVCHFDESDYYLCVSKKRPDLLSELNAAQNLLRNEEPNYLNSLKIKYYPSTVSSMAFSDKEKLWLESHDEIRVGYLNDYLPYSTSDSDGNVYGIVSDIITKIEEKLGISSIKVLYKGYNSYDSMVSDVTKGNVDLIFPVGGGIYYAEESGIYQSNPLVTSSITFVCQKDFPPLSAAKLDLTFAVNKNNTMQYYYIVANFPYANVKYYNSTEECLSAVQKKQVSATILNGLRNEILKNREYKNLSLRQLTASDDRCFGVQIGNEGLLKLLNRGINIIGSDFAQNLSYYYSQDLYTYTTLDFIKDHMAIFALLILASAIFIIFFLVRDANHSKRALLASENASSAKMAFLNNMTHDIQTPMNAILGFTTLAAMNINSKEKLSDYLKKISISSRHLLSLINNVLDMSRLESQSVTINEDQVNLFSIISELETIIRKGIEEKNLELEISKDIRHSSIITDKLRLNQVLLNIIDNAIKFSPYRGKIFISVREVSDESRVSSDKSLYEFRIRDCGRGMSESFKKVVFEPFSREEDAALAKSQGSGLGLAITKKVVELMNGTIDVISEEGRGSEFIITLPLKLCTFPVLKEDDDNSFVDFSGRKVLLTEDTDTNQMIAKDILESAGFNVDIAKDGVEAVEKMKIREAGYYDIILMDPYMPNMDGFEATRQIRSLPEKQKALIPIIGLSSSAFGEDRFKSFECGMNAHLAKPYDIPTLLRTIKGLLK